MALYGIAFITERILPPHFLVYLVVSKNAPPVYHQQIKKIILLYCKIDFLTATVYLPAVGINLQSRNRQHRLILQPQIFKIGMPFQDFHNLLKDRGILLAEFNH